jgi:LPPG:FO 2-phospho-L-lactate transferase
VIAVLSGGVGGARFVHGLAQALENPGDLCVVANPGDDFEWHGLPVCPDADTVLYTLAGLVNPETGWGVGGDTFAALGQLERLGEPGWFRVGDRDLALHLLRRDLLGRGLGLTRALAEIAARLGVAARVLPASDDPVRTRVRTPQGELAFQDYFVRRQARDRVLAVGYDGAASARPSAAVLDALREADLVLIAPSNPVLSIGPILAIPGIREAVAARRAVAVSPLIGGRAVKGPTVEALAALGVPPTPAGIAGFYRGLLRGLVVDRADALDAAGLGLPCLVTDTLMRDAAARGRLAREVLAWASGPSSR